MENGEASVDLSDNHAHVQIAEILPNSENCPLFINRELIYSKKNILYLPELLEVFSNNTPVTKEALEAIILNFGTKYQGDFNGIYRVRDGLTYMMYYSVLFCQSKEILFAILKSLAEHGGNISAQAGYAPITLTTCLARRDDIDADDVVTFLSKSDINVDCAAEYESLWHEVSWLKHGRNKSVNTNESGVPGNKSQTPEIWPGFRADLQKAIAERNKKEQHLLKMETILEFIKKKNQTSKNSKKLRG